MNILITYGTNSGNTLHVAKRLDENLNQTDHSTTLKPIQEVSETEIDSVEAIVLGCCTWEWIKDGQKLDGQLQDHMRKFVSTHQELDLKSKPCAIFALGHDNYTQFCAAADKLEKFISQSKGKHIGETLRINGFPHKQQDAIDAWTSSLVPLLES